MSSARRSKTSHQATGIPSIGDPEEGKRLDKIKKMVPVEVDRSEYEAAIGEVYQSDLTETVGDSCATDAHLALKLPRGPAIDPNGYHRRHVQLQLDGVQSLALAQLHAALEAKQEKLLNGRLITSGADAIRYLLEQLHAVGNETKTPNDETNDGENETTTPPDAQ